jgi:pimeloyl-ACP methyl ester carboxylesterase
VWDAQFQTFAEHYRVIRYDLRGHGKSAIPGGESYSHAGDLKALLDHLNIQRAFIIGQSLGGEIAINFALAYPETAARIVLVDPSLDGYDWSSEWGESWLPIYAEYARSGASASLPMLLAHPLFAPGFRNPAMKGRLGEILSDYSGWHILNDDPVIEENPPAIERLDQIRAQVLILIGHLDLPDFHAISDILLEKIPRAQKIEFVDAGHVLPMEAPDKVNKAVLSFLLSD